MVDEFRKAWDDARFCGHGFMKDGKHVPVGQVVAAPMRIQRKRMGGWKMPENTLYVGRPTRFGNPFFCGHHARTRQEAVRLFREWLDNPHTTYLPIHRQHLLGNLWRLRGKNLACWCPEGQPCHADVLLEKANA